MKRTFIIVLFATLGISEYFIATNSLQTKPLHSSPEPSTLTDRLHSVETIVQINPNAFISKPQPEIIRTSQFFQTQFDIIKSQETLTRAIEDNNLTELYNTDKATLLKQIKANLEVHQKTGTDLIVITTFSNTEEKALQLCKAIVISYDKQRRLLIETTRNEVIAKYKKEYKLQKDKVEEHRKKLYKLAQDLGITYNPDNRQTAEQDQPKITSDKQHAQFDKVIDDYEKELKILKHIKSAEYGESVISGLELVPLQYHKYPTPIK